MQCRGAQVQQCYRDLSKPIGALNPKRFRDFLERFREQKVWRRQSQPAVLLTGAQLLEVWLPQKYGPPRALSLALECCQLKVVVQEMNSFQNAKLPTTQSLEFPPFLYGVSSCLSLTIM